jgi:hypothetical protein
MEDVSGNTRPDNSAVFEMTNGERVRVNYDDVYSYVSKGTATVVQVGWSDKQSYILDIDFDSFDAKLTQYKADLKSYYNEYDCY